MTWKLYILGLFFLESELKSEKRRTSEVLLDMAHIMGNKSTDTMLLIHVCHTRPPATDEKFSLEISCRGFGGK